MSIFISFQEHTEFKLQHEITIELATFGIDRWSRKAPTSRIVWEKTLGVSHTFPHRIHNSKLVTDHFCSITLSKLRSKPSTILKTLTNDEIYSFEAIFEFYFKDSTSSLSWNFREKNVVDLFQWYSDSMDNFKPFCPRNHISILTFETAVSIFSNEGKNTPFWANLATIKSKCMTIPFGWEKFPVRRP